MPELPPIISMGRVFFQKKTQERDFMTDSSPSAQTRPVRDIELTLPHIQLQAKAWGAPDGQPVLALHGWLDNAETFSRLIPLLPEELYIVALDLPGHGLSQHREKGAMYHFIEWVPDIFDAADALGWDMFSLMGHSMGAGAATLAAGAMPQRVERLVLLEGIGPLTTPPSEAPAQMRRALEQRHRYFSREHRVYPDVESAIEQRMNGFPVEEEGARLLVERGTKMDQEGVRFRFAQMLRATSLMRLTEPVVHAFLSAIECPTLFVRASEGFLHRPGVDERVKQCKPMTVLDVEGGHHVHLDAPERIATQVAEHLHLSS